MTVFRDPAAAMRERVLTLAENVAEEIAGIDPLVRAHAEGERAQAITLAEALATRAQVTLQTLDAAELTALEQQLETLLPTMTEERATTAARRAALLSVDHAPVPATPRAFTKDAPEPPWQVGRRSGAEGLEDALRRALAPGTRVETKWVVDPRAEHRGFFGFLEGPLWGALSVRFEAGERPMHLLCETQVSGSNVHHHFVMSGAVARALGTCSFRFYPEMEPHLPKPVGKPLAALARYDVPVIQVVAGTAHVYVSFELESRLLSLMRAVLVGLRELPPEPQLADIVREARERAR